MACSRVSFTFTFTFTSDSAVSFRLIVLLPFRSSASVLLWQSAIIHESRATVNGRHLHSNTEIAGVIQTLTVTDSPLQDTSQSAQSRACDPPLAVALAVSAARSLSVAPELFFLPAPVAAPLAAARPATLHLPSETTALNHLLERKLVLRKSQRNEYKWRL